MPLVIPRLLLILLLPRIAAAQPALAPPPDGGEPETRRFRYSPYEQATIDGALRTLGLQLDDRPEGKTVEAVQFVRLEVIEERDPAPRFLNYFHVITRPEVIDREVLLRPGAPYQQTLADETQRNLAAVPQLSLVLVVAARATRPDRVQLVVITKDVWSLRLSWDVALASSGLEGLTLEPSETNFLGTQQTVGLLFTWLPRSYSLGALYSSPHFFASHVVATVDLGLIMNSTTGSREGSFADLVIGRPLWSSRTEWAWKAGVSWRKEITRRYSDGQLARFALDPLTDCTRSPGLCVPDAFRTEVLKASASLTRSFGWALKRDFTLGFQAQRLRYGLPDLTGYDPATVDAYDRARVPVSDDRVGPYVQMQIYSTNFLRVLDLETLALQEDVRLGPEAYLRLYPMLRALGSSRDFAGLSGGVSYTLGLGDGLARAGLESIAELASGRVRDGSVKATLRLASPRWTLGRLVLDGLLLDRYANFLNHQSQLGGDTRLRGYPSAYWVGPNALSVNLEWRSRPWEILESLQLGGVLFYDAGDAFGDWKSIHLSQSAGLGARFLFPQLDRLAFRIDVGFPLARPLPSGVSPLALFATFGQAFPLDEITPATAVTR